MGKFSFMLPRYFRLIGIVLFASGMLLGIVRFHFGQKPEMLDLKIFAVYSSYLQTKMFEFIRNNMAEEFTGILLITGLFFIAFSKEKQESAVIQNIRLKAFFLAFYINLVFLLASFLLTFGIAFIYMAIFNMGFGLMAYIIAFRILILLNKSKPEKST